MILVDDATGGSVNYPDTPIEFFARFELSRANKKSCQILARYHIAKI